MSMTRDQAPLRDHPPSKDDAARIEERRVLEEYAEGLREFLRVLGRKLLH